MNKVIEQEQKPVPQTPLPTGPTELPLFLTTQAVTKQTQATRSSALQEEQKSQLGSKESMKINLNNISR